ncbi:potassium efflux system protein [Renibacterium salmoninarum ATCC 33209]|uniref:Potassium efflux system protein n=1 Tax=Renibacterium salmoninarum (strain ATCC 33209 / DSM 20767 / JCM 11484 / NBRC 15589 / NCIMB 2235) TaxID=288705 RepID=A9WT04_RENSM|nr:Na+/H+ antiporter subunit A [Renibacterium salmoninarum]ABY23942.1 potassium efflux system protein [Renibacterium salmoninarum ATCC 33209]
MLTILTAHFVVALIAPFFFRWLGRNAFYVLAAVPAGSFIWLLAQYDAIEDGKPPMESFSWISDFGLNISFQLDDLAWLLSLLILGVGALVLAYCARYFKTDDGAFRAHGAGFGAQLLAFAGVMFGLVAADDLILLFIFWELTTVLSYLLIGYSRTRIAARRAALQALMVTTFGGLTMLVGIIMLGQAAGTYQISEILNHVPTGTLVDIGVFLILIGAVSKSALIPFHFWLPGAMAAPTPVSAYLHAAAMVKAGIFLIAMLAPAFAHTPFWQPTVIVLGLGTMLVGGWRALRQNDLKLILAYGTVSQLGFLTLVVGLGTPAGALAGMALLLAHGLFKATLFLVVGIIDHQTGTRDIRKLSGVFRASRVLGVIAAIGAASMAGVPLMAGFVAKEAVYQALINFENPWVVAGAVIGSMLTVAYSARFWWGGFARKSKGMATAFGKVSTEFLAAPAILAVLTVVAGIWFVPVQSWIEPYSNKFLTSGEKDPYLSLFSGFNLALWLSVLTLSVGALLFVFRERIERAQDKIYPLIDAEKGYRNIIGAIDDVAIWVTGRTQRGSLFFYLAVILSATVGVNIVAVLMSGRPFPEVYFFDPGSPAQLVAAVVIIIGAVAAARANKRFLAVLMVSVTGYGIALIFAFQGAPDLALTQMFVESIILVAFVLAMRSLPPELRDRTRGSHRFIRMLIGIAFGATMVVVALIALGARVDAPISLEFPKLAYDIGGGLNIVNVTLVDLRAWDTFGEISVLAIAATGVASLIFVRNRGDALPRAVTLETGSIGRRHHGSTDGARDVAALRLARKFATVGRDAWLVAGRTLAPERRSIIFEVITRLLFHSMIIFSVYLLLAGHNFPGGGFAGGLMAGLALTLRYLAGGRAELAEATPISAGALLGTGLGTAALSGIAPLFFGGQVFQTAIWSFSLPIFGDIKFVTSTVFDIGVYLIVVGLVLDVLRSLGAEIDEREEERRDDMVVAE